MHLHQQPSDALILFETPRVTLLRALDMTPYKLRSKLSYLELCYHHASNAKSQDVTDQISWP